MKIVSPAFKDGKTVPEKYTCKGSNINPPLDFSDIPEGTKSLTLTIEDRDAVPQTWIHWLVFNIPPTTTHIDENSIPDGGTEGYANGGTPGYEGPCPIYFRGIHHYYFTLFALNTVLDVPKTSSKRDLKQILDTHVIEKAEFMGIAEGTGEKITG